MTNERKRVPDTFGRLYADDTPVGGTLGTWVRRAEVDSLLDEIEGAHHDIDRLMAACTAEANEVERLRAHLRDIGSLATPEDSADDERQFARMREMVMAALSGSHEPCEPRPRPNSPEDIRESMDLLQKIHRESASRAAPGVVQRVCHALTDNCVMFTDPEREPCTPENCKAVKASRDASSIPTDAKDSDPVPPCAHPMAWRRYDGAGQPYCEKCGASNVGISMKSSPADLVGALQDVVHTDPGPVRAGKAHRGASSGQPCCLEDGGECDCQPADIARCLADSKRT